MIAEVLSRFSFARLNPALDFSFGDSMIRNLKPGDICVQYSRKQALEASGEVGHVHGLVFTGLVFGRHVRFH